MSSFTRRAGRWAAALSAAALVAACQASITVDAPAPAGARAAQVAEAGATVAWNKVARDMVVKYGTSAPATIRVFAILSVAQYNALVDAEKSTTGSPQSTERGAVAGASVAVLKYIYPAEATFLEGLVDQQEASPASPAGGPKRFAAGESIGRAVAASVIARASTDRFFEPFTGTVPLCAACWKATPTPPAFATLGQAKPFFLASNSQFRPAPHPAFGSPEYNASLAEVRQIADTRTTQQDSIAKYWALPAGTVSAQGYWNVLASELALRYHLSERETAHRLALMNMAAYDAIVASHEAKYHYWLIRPSQADPLIVRAIGLPSFPSYPSNHATLAATAATVLGTFFPSERAWLEAHAQEGADSRVYGGIHYRFDTEAGLVLGRKIGGWALANDVVGHEPFVLK